MNNRFIKDKTLFSAAEQGFKGLLQIGKFGFLILNLKVNPGKIDVNVHPTKLEIRFEEEQKVFKAVYHSIKESLLQGDLVRNETVAEEKENVVETLKSSILRGETEKFTTKEIEQAVEPKIESLPEQQEVQKPLSSFKNLFKKKNETEEDEVFVEQAEEKENMMEEIYQKKQANIIRTRGDRNKHRKNARSSSE